MTDAPLRTASGPQLPDGAWGWLHDFGRWLGTWIFRPVFRLRILGRDRIPRTGPVVLVANHSSMLDGPVLFGAIGRRVVFLIKIEMFTGALGWALRHIGQIPVRRGEPDRTPLLTAVRLLRAGGLVGVFPEGTRGEGDVSNAEHGAAWLARSSGALVLPVATRGTRKEPGKRRFRPRVDVLFGTPFALPAGRGRAALAESTELIKTNLSGLVAELDARRAGQPVPVEPGPDVARRDGVSGEGL